MLNLKRLNQSSEKNRNRILVKFSSIIFLILLLLTPLSFAFSLIEINYISYAEVTSIGKDRYLFTGKEKDGTT